MDMKECLEELETQNACREAVEWSSQFDVPQEAWEACDRGDWMLWKVGKKAGPPWSEKRKKLVLASCKCARLVWDLMPQPSKGCIELFEQWANGKQIPIEALKKARRASADASSADASASAADAAHAAYDAYASASASAADAAYAASYAASSAHAASSAARKKTLKQCADIVRKYYPDINEILEI